MPVTYFRPRKLGPEERKRSKNTGNFFRNRVSPVEWCQSALAFQIY